MTRRRASHWPSLAVLATGLFVVGPVGIHAQTSTAVCLSSFNWMDNSKSQNPCLISAYLQGACNGGQFTVDPLPSDSHYTGPYVDESDPCQCSSVTYNTISACGLCQNRTIISWSTWNFNCTTVYPGVFTPGVPGGTAVPAWAFQDVTASDFFNVTLAQSTGDNPESTATIAQSTASVGPTSTDYSSPSSPTNSSSSTSSSKSNTAAIAGGVVGGVVGLALIAGVVVFFVVKNRRSQVPRPAQFTGHQAPPAYPSHGFAEPATFSPVMTQPKLYDPSDPSTFPASPPPATIMTGSSGHVQSNPVNYPTATMRPGGVYSGVPEL